MEGSVPPHGGKLLPLLANSDEREEGLKKAKSLAMLVMGAFSFSSGFYG